MDLRQLPALNALHAFEAAARHESFSRAADELFVTHGAVSHQIRALEAELGVPLFARDGKRVRLTEVGRQYAAEVRAALITLAEATRRVRAGDRDRRLVVSMLSSFSARLVTPRIGGFIEKHPEIDLELLSTNALTDFARDDVDVAIRFGFGKYAGLHAEELLDEVFFPACSPNVQRRQAAAHARRSRQRRRCCARTTNCGARGSTPPDSPTCPSRSAACCIEDSSNLLQAAIDGQGIALVRRSLAMHEIVGGPARAAVQYRRAEPVDSTSSSARRSCSRRSGCKTFRAWIFDEVAARSSAALRAHAAAHAMRPARHVAWRACRTQLKALP